MLATYLTTWQGAANTILLKAQIALDQLLLPAEGMPEEGQKGSKTIWWIVGIVGVVLVLFCLIPVCIIFILSLLGPAIGNVFSNIIEGI